MKNRDPPRGTALDVYLFALKHGPCEVRDIQHTLNLSTPSLAAYHLNKLTSAGYLKKDNYGRYYSSGMQIDVLEGYVKIGRSLIPSFFFFTLLFSALIGIFAILSVGNPYYIPDFIIVAVGAAAALWYETLRLWRKLV